MSGTTLHCVIVGRYVFDGKPPTMKSGEVSGASTFIWEGVGEYHTHGIIGLYLMGHVERGEQGYSQGSSVFTVSLRCEVAVVSPCSTQLAKRAERRAEAEKGLTEAQEKGAALHSV